jgi:hypothetical protein
MVLSFQSSSAPLSKIFPAKESLAETTIYGTDNSSQLSEKENPSSSNQESNIDAVNVGEKI